ncbi:MAG: hypothetical protein IJQ03_03475 [Firmicutes bacterium]|nr:hypothetical protein [Bacillota bacterium]
MNTLWEANYADDTAADRNGNVAAVTTDGRLFLLKEGQIVSSRQVSDGKETFRS